jgi:hypothetical protein
MLRACEKAWSLKVKGRTRAGRTGFFQRVCRKAGITISRGTTKEEAKVQLALVQQALKEYQREHETKRQNWLEAMAEAQSGSAREGREESIGAMMRSSR